MNAVEIEEAVSQLAEAPFDPEEFPFAFLEAFGNKKTTIKRLKSQRNSTNKSDLDGVLQRNNIHIKVCLEGEVTDTLTALRESPATAKQKAKFILATDGKSLEAENLADGETIVCDYPEFHNHFGFFLPLAGITTVKQIRENAFDIKATGRLNKLYVELLNENPDWDSAERREELNHLMARLIFCFFAEDTNIFYSNNLFTDTIAQMSAGDSSNTHEVLEELFRAMATPLKQREKAGIRNWANGFPYVNGGLFSPHPLTPSPLSPSGRGAGGEGNSLGKYPHPLAPSPKQREGGQETMSEGKYWEIPPALKKKMTEVARQFRKEPTPSEKILWQALRGRKLEGRKFRRQQPIGAFIVDFFCGAERLIVEVDGGIHQSQQEADQQRQELLESLGLKVVRVSSELVETNLAEALAVVRQGFSPHPLTPSPKQGEGGQETPTPLSPSGRGAGGEGLIVPRFSRIARSYLLHVGNLDWTKINPDIFGSMIQAVADEDERGALGMHYTSVPNILKVLNPLFLDDLREQLAAAGDNGRKLLNLRKRLARIRVFDPACGSGNFLVIAYKEMRAIEAEINQRRGEADRASEIPLTNFRGIEIRHFSCEIARLALIIAEYQCDVLYRGQRLALAEFLPLKAENWITCGNALRLDWLSLCPPTDKGVRVQREDLDLWQETRDEAEIEFENEGGETYICGNPPYLGSTWQSKEQKAEIRDVVNNRTKSPGFLDYVSGWFIKAADWLQHSEGRAAFVSTNSICQGQMVPLLWQIIWNADCEILFAHTSFKWSNLASHNAGVTVAIVCIGRTSNDQKALFEIDQYGKTSVRLGSAINPYLTFGNFVIVKKTTKPISKRAVMEFGNKPSDGGNLLVSREEINNLGLSTEQKRRFLRTIVGSGDFINGNSRYCIWIEDSHLEEALSIEPIARRVELVRKIRLASRDKGANALAQRAHQLKLMRIGKQSSIVVPAVSSERRNYLPAGLIDRNTTITNAAFALYDAPLWNMAIIASRLHLVWIATVCGKLETRYRYSNTLGWNTFPVPTLTEQNKTDLTCCAEDILLAREQYFPATIADMYDPERMDKEFPLVREAHERNDEVLERIYIGRRFKNDTERLEKLFELYTKMTAPKSS
ncbi:DNA methyltransferase [Coleofasciculus chthonoplastes]|uniref:DNA methyltransferase n=1 Tax=Coleofasciculus chthonoplastes TaxID=64178 RepID=UPI0032F9BCE0